MSAEEVSSEAEGPSMEDFIEAALAAGKGWSEEEKNEYLDNIDIEKHPMFADKLEDMDPDMVAALQAVTYEDETPESLAEHFKAQGNKLFARARVNPLYYGHAAKYYTDALQHAKEANRTPELEQLMATLLANRAACNLGLKNYGSVKADCDASLGMVPGNSKCYFRKAKALALLRRYKEAAACCTVGLNYDPENKDMVAIQKQCTNALRALAEREAETARKEQQKVQAIRDIWDRCHPRGIRLGPPAFRGGYNQHHAQQRPRLEAGGGLVWPLLLLYPEHGQSDCIEEVAEDTMLALQLASVLPEEGPFAPWDQGGRYTVSQVEVYIQLRVVKPFKRPEEFIASWRGVRASGSTVSQAAEAEDQSSSDDEVDYSQEASQRWVQVHPGCTLLEVLKCKGYVVPGGCPVLHVYSRDSQVHSEFQAQHRLKMGVLNPQPPQTTEDDAQV